MKLRGREMKHTIPKRCVRIARHDNTNMTAGVDVWFDSKDRAFYIKAESFDSNGEEVITTGGPFSIGILELMKEVVADVVAMKGRYSNV
jgi:hypothetical protein